MLKRIVKKIMGEDHWSYLSCYRSTFGLFHAIVAYTRLLRNNGIDCVLDAASGGRMFVRPGTTDLNLFKEIFIMKEYDIDIEEPLFIIDAGANIGLSSAYFAGKYPGATIVAIEPEKSNFDMLVKNTGNYENIKSIQAGLWSRKTKLIIQNPDDQSWSFRVIENSTLEGIQAVGITDVMKDFCVTRIDLLKIDIEGSELEVLNHSQPWMNFVRTLIIELHDRFQPGCTEALEKALQGYDYEQSTTISGESLIINNIRRKT